jgi:hypothetical protein
MRSWRPVLVVEEARVPGQPPTIGKQVVNFIIRLYGIKYKILTDPIGMQPTASIPFGHMADLELGSDV